MVFADRVPACSSPFSRRRPPVTDGPTLYANNCAACHGALASSAKGGATLARTQGAIAGNVGGMAFLSSLSTTQLQAIVAALATASPPPTTAVTDGADAVREQLRRLPQAARHLDQGRRDADANAGRDRRQRRRHGVPVVAVDRAAAGDRRGARDGEPAAAAAR